MTRQKNETEDLLLSITKNFETLIKQTHRKPQETLEFELTYPRQTFPYKPFIDLGPNSKLVGFTCLEVYIPVFFCNTRK